LIETVAAKPYRMFIINLETQERFKAQFNPETFTETLRANWASLDVIGLPYQPLHYTNTSNTVFSFVLSFYSDTEAEFAVVQDAHHFLRSLFFPSSPGAAPPDLLFFWPGLVTMRTKIGSVTFTYRRFNINGQVTIFDAEIELTQITDVRRLGADIRTQGAEVN